MERKEEGSMEELNYVCSHLERVDELLALLVFFFFLLVLQLAFFACTSRRHADLATQLLELKRQKKQSKLSDWGTYQTLNASEYLTEASQRKPKVVYEIENGTKGAQVQGPPKGNNTGGSSNPTKPDAASKPKKTNIK